MTQRERNQQNLADKMARQEQMRMEEAMKRQMNLHNKEMMNNTVKQSKDMARTHTKMTAQETKKEKMLAKQRNNDQRAYEEAKHDHGLENAGSPTTSNGI